MLKDEEFHPMIQHELDKCTKILSASAYYFKLFDLMGKLGPTYPTILDRPLSNVFSHKDSISHDAKLSIIDMLAELLLLKDQSRFQHYTETFFLNVYEYFMSPLKLLLVLIGLFLVKIKKSKDLNVNSEIDQVPELGPKTRSLTDTVDLRESHSTKDRILLFLELWISRRDKDFTLDRGVMLELLASFTKYLRSKVTHSDWSVANLVDLIESVQFLIHRLRSEEAKQLVPQIANCSPEKSSPFMFTRLNRLKNLLKTTPAEVIAKILIHISLQEYLQLGRYELFPRRIDHALQNSPTKRPDCSMTQYIERVNTFSQALVMIVLNEPTPELRASLLAKYLQVFKWLEEPSLGVIDLESQYQLSLVFRHVSLTQLRETLKLLNSILDNPDRELLSKIRLIETKQEFIRNLEFLTINKPVRIPIVPCISVFMQIISVHHARQPSFIESKYISLHKMSFISSTMNNFFSMKGSSKLLEFQKLNSDLTTHDLYPLLLSKGYLPVLSKQHGGENRPSFIDSELFKRAKRLETSISSHFV